MHIDKNFERFWKELVTLCIFSFKFDHNWRCDLIFVRIGNVGCDIEMVKGTLKPTNREQKVSLTVWCILYHVHGNIEIVKGLWAFESCDTTFHWMTGLLEPVLSPKSVVFCFWNIPWVALSSSVSLAIVQQCLQSVTYNCLVTAGAWVLWGSYKYSRISISYECYISDIKWFT